jgi:hypothetical protein
MFRNWVFPVAIALAGACTAAHAQPPAPPANETIQEKLKRIINNPDPKIAEAIKRETAHDNVTIKNFRWTGNGIGLMTAGFTFENGNDFSIKDPKVSCELTGQSGTTLNTKTQTIFVSIPKKSRKTVSNINFGPINSQAHSGSCRVTSVTPAAP